MGNYLRKQAYSGQSRRITAALERLGKVEERLQISEPRGPVETHPSLPGETHLSLHSVIAVTDQLLPEEARQALYALAVFPPKPNSFSEEAALAVIACDVEFLDLLIDSGLLEFTSSSGRYTIHQTISNYAQLHLNSTEPQQRLIHYVIAFVEQHKKDYELLDQESAIILHALDLAYALGMKEELVRAVSAFAPYFLRGFYSLAEKHLQRAHEAAVALDDKYDITTMLLYIGEIAQQQGNFGQAEETFQEGLNLARQIDHQGRICAFLNNLGWAAQKQGKLTQAETYLQEGLALARQIDDKERICGILKVIGTVVMYSGNYSQAETYYHEGLTLARQIRADEQACLLLINLGVALAEQGKFDQAVVFYQEGLNLARQSGHRERISALLANLGYATLEQEDYVQAEEYCREGLLLARQIEHREWTSVLLCNLGIVMHKQGNYDEAETYLKEGLILTQEIGIPQLTAQLLDELGSLYLSQLRIKEAENSFSEMRAIVPEDCLDLIALAYYGLARVAATQGNYHKSRELGEDCLKTLEDIGHHKAREVKRWLSSTSL